MTIDLNIFYVGKEPNELYEQPIGVNLVNEIATWSSFEDSEIESFLEKDVQAQIRGLIEKFMSRYMI